MGLAAAVPLSSCRCDLQARQAAHLLHQRQLRVHEKAELRRNDKLKVCREEMWRGAGGRWMALPRVYFSIIIARTQKA